MDINQMDIANLRAMKRELEEKIKLKGNSINENDEVYNLSENLRVIEATIESKMSNLGQMLNS